MDWLKTRLLEAGRRPIELARHLGIPPARVYEMLKGERKIQPQEIPKVASFLAVSPAQIIALMTEGNGIQTMSTIQSDGGLEGPITVLRAIRNQISGEWTVYNDKAGEVTRPDFMTYASRAFAITVLDDVNSPVYRVRDKVLIDPDTPIGIGDDCLLMADFVEGGGAPALLGRLLKEDDKHWTVQQYNLERPIKAPKTRYSSAYPVTGRYITR
jgi:hypothetical protein